MFEYLNTIDKITSILAIFFIFILWVLSRNFISKEEAKKELSFINDTTKEEFKSIYQDLNKQKLNIVELNTKIDNLIRTVDQLNLMVDDIRKYLLRASFKHKEK